jgi:hypothetical protein
LPFGISIPMAPAISRSEAQDGKGLSSLKFRGDGRARIFGIWSLGFEISSACRGAVA